MKLFGKGRYDIIWGEYYTVWGKYDTLCGEYVTVYGCRTCVGIACICPVIPNRFQTMVF